MKMRLAGGVLTLIEVDALQFNVIKSWGKMKYSKKDKSLSAVADIELLDKLNDMVQLPAYIEAYRQGIHKVQDAVDRERTTKEPKPLMQYPVKLPLYQHQVRGANMALLTFGWVPPEGGTR